MLIVDQHGTHTAGSSSSDHTPVRRQVNAVSFISTVAVVFSSRALFTFCNTLWLLIEKRENQLN